MRDYFCGWYFKCQSDKETLAVIPAVHEAKGKSSCSIQLITDKGSWNMDFPYRDFCREGSIVRIGENLFDKRGLRLNLKGKGLSADGTLRFGELSPIRYDIMGPFRYVPLMECRHSVLSMKHTVCGTLCVNGDNYVFSNDSGYIEGDRGRSFPKEYAWTQCFFKKGSLMLSVADIPLCGLHFTGVIGIVLFDGREYRLATYLGAKAERIKNGEVMVLQGDMRFTARILEKKAHPLSAPVTGAMKRTIRESPACRAYYCFEKAGKILFEFEAPNASFEYEYPW